MSEIDALKRKRKRYEAMVAELEKEKTMPHATSTFLRVELGDKIEAIDQDIKMRVEFEEIRQRSHRSSVIHTCLLVFAAGLFFVGPFWWVPVGVSFLVLVALTYRVFTEKTKFERVLTGIFYFVLLIVVVAGYAHAYLHLGLEDTAVAVNETPRRVDNYRDALYFSIVTWTTVGYGDIRPSSGARFWAGTEALFGYCHMSLLIAYIVNMLSAVGKAQEKGAAERID